LQRNREIKPETFGDQIENLASGSAGRVVVSSVVDALEKRLENARERRDQDRLFHEFLRKIASLRATYPWFPVVAYDGSRGDVMGAADERVVAISQAPLWRVRRQIQSIRNGTPNAKRGAERLSQQNRPGMPFLE